MDKNKIQIIPVKEEDAGVIYATANNPELMEIFCDKPSELHVWQHAIKEWLKDKDENDFVIIRQTDGLSIGWIGINGLESSDGTVWIKMIAMLPEHWGKGYGSNTVKIVKDVLRNMGFSRVRLWTDECNTRAQLCYKANSFRVISKNQSTIGTLNVVRDRLLMECDL